jgi:hypothetical protein
LSTISAMLIDMPMSAISAIGKLKKLSGSNQASLSTAAQNRSIARLAPGPAAATHSMSLFGCRRRPKLTGTGFAQPNRMLLSESNRMIAGTRIVPTGSICLSGLAVIRPACHAVGSPKWRAA